MAKIINQKIYEMFKFKQFHKTFSYHSSSEKFIWKPTAYSEAVVK